MLMSDSIPDETRAELKNIEPSPSQITQKQTGAIRKLKPGYGFIAADDGNNYFFHWTAMERTSVDFRELAERMRVDFIVVQSDRGPRAIQVRVIS